MFKAFKKLETDNEYLDRVQDNVHAVIGQLPAVQIIQGRLVKDISLTNGATSVVEHKLGRAPLGWFVVRKDGASDIWDTQSTNRSQALTLLLTCNADVNVDIWVF